MIRAVLVALALLGACAPTASPPPVSPAPSAGSADAATPGQDSCGLAAHQNLIGMDESAIDRSTLPARSRIICFGCMATMDYVPERLTIQIGPGHKVASLRCG